MFKSVLTHYRSRNYAFENVFLGLPHKLIIVITINGNERYIHFFTFAEFAIRTYCSALQKISWG